MTLFTLTLLTGKTRTWGDALVTNASPLMNDYTAFIQDFKAVFYHPCQGRVCGQSLLELKQGVQTAPDYAMEFQTLAAGTRWNEPTLVAAFMHGLRADLQAELTSLNEVVHLAIACDRLLQERRRQFHRGLPRRENDSTIGQVEALVEPMQLGM
ncbi:hypothetical protein P4O66_001574 [Electrophorus voltai]|uniref:Retrotransposon gag domain-containing protein n=1 Tax=Electrophorus voltai TaxID=2609070 RepID=A0AAD9DSP8_9TELE|nr:hypothetical protein P4O66_001574 [Electrophorus voltai]